MKICYSLVIIASLFTTTTAAAAHKRGNTGLDGCLQAIQKIQQGQFLRVEYRSFSHEGKPSYEIEMKDKNGEEWEFECDRKARIIEIEREVNSANNILFKKHAKVKENDARNTALAMYPGKVEKVEYELEFDGTPSYEFNIESNNGTEFNVEVNAVTGKITEVSVESWEIGNDE